MLGTMAVDLGLEAIAFVPKSLHLVFYFCECRVIGSGEIGHLRRRDCELDRELHERFR
jgi:hypothetical protein